MKAKMLSAPRAPCPTYVKGINGERARKGKKPVPGGCGDERLPEPTGTCLDFPALNTFD